MIAEEKQTSLEPSSLKIKTSASGVDSSACVLVWVSGVKELLGIGHLHIILLGHHIFIRATAKDLGHVLKYMDVLKSASQSRKRCGIVIVVSEHCQCDRMSLQMLVYYVAGLKCMQMT